jgi:cytochrome c-type biogenesis protein CcmH/NrfF
VLLGGLLLVFLAYRHRSRRAAPSGLSKAEQRRLKQLLGEE